MQTKEILIAHINRGEEFEYLFFWDEPKKDIVDIACLNQWYAATFTKKEEFVTAEHYMMYTKAILFDDWDSAKEILATKSPKEVQLLGRKVKDFNEEVWQKAAFDIVVEGNMHKFTQNLELADFLLATEDKILVEASPIDTIWGIGLCASDPKATNPKEWLGENKLGFALMEVRDTLKEKRR